MKIKTISKIILIMLILTIFLPIIKVEAIMKNNNPLLREITINGEYIQPEFDQFITNYVLAVDEKEEKIEIKAVTDDPNATVQIIGDTNLKKGTNEFEIKVIAEDRITTNSYFLHITRGNVEKANANLKNIEIEGLNLNPQFNQKDTNYYVEYNGYIEKLNINAIPENANAKVEISNNENFSSTLHEVIVKVIAEDGITIKEYKIMAKKAGEQLEDPSGLESYEKDLANKKAEETTKKRNNILLGLGTIIIILIIVILVVMVKRGKKK